MAHRLALGTLFVASSFGMLGLPGIARAAEPAATERTAAAESDARLYQQVVAKGIDFLTTKGEQADGSYGKDVGPGVAAICTSACCVTADHRTIRRSRRA